MLSIFLWGFWTPSGCKPMGRRMKNGGCCLHSGSDGLETFQMSSAGISQGKCPIQPARLFQYYIVVNIHNPSVFSWTLCDLQDKLHIHCHNFAGLTTCAQNDLLGQGNRRSSQLKVHRNGKSYILIPQNAALILGSVEKRWPLQARTQSKTHPKKMRCARLGSGSLPLAEMKRFELLRRFEADLPHFECVRNFRTWRNLTEAGGSCGNPKKPEFPRVLRRQKRKKRGNS